MIKTYHDLHCDLCGRNLGTTHSDVGVLLQMAARQEWNKQVCNLCADPDPADRVLRLVRLRLPGIWITRWVEEGSDALMFTADLETITPSGAAQVKPVAKVTARMPPEGFDAPELYDITAEQVAVEIVQRLQDSLRDQLKEQHARYLEAASV